jgi:hypothetical protein
MSSLLVQTIAAFETYSWTWRNNVKCGNWRYAYASGFVVLAEGLDMFRIGAIVTDGNMNTSGNLSFKKISLVGWMSES